MARSFSGDVTIRFRADTRMAEANVRRFGNSFSRLGLFTRRLRAGLLGMTTPLMGQGAAMVGIGLAARSAVRNFERYSNAQATLRSILASTSDDIRLQRGLMMAADAGARRYGYSLGESAEAMGVLHETGISAQESMRYFGIVSEFSRAANVDLERSSRVLVDSMRQFNLQSEEGARFLAGAFTVAGRMSSTSVEELQQAFRYASVEMSGLGYSAEETISALAGISAIGLRSTTAGTRMRRMIVQLITPTQTTTRRLAELLNISDELAQSELYDIMYDEIGNRRHLADTTLRLAAMFQRFGTVAEQNEAAVRLFGVRGLAPGVMFSQLHARGADWLNILEELQDPTRVNALLTRSAEEQMKGFGAQMRLARTAAEELGITFMGILFNSTEEASDGFGRFLSNMVLAIRGADENNRLTGESGAQYRALSEEMRTSGREWRETLQGLAELLKILGKFGLFIGRIAGEYPRLTAGTVIFGSIARPMFGSIIGALGTMSGWLRIAGLNLWRFGRYALGADGLFASFLGRALGIAGLVSLVFTLSSAAQGWAASLMGVRGEFDKISTALRGQMNIIVRYIPIVNQVAYVFSRVAYYAVRALQAWRELTGRETAGGKFETVETETRIGRRMETLRGRMEGAQPGEIRRAATQREITEQIFALASQFRGMGQGVMETKDSMRRALMETGLTSQTISQYNDQIARAARQGETTANMERSRLQRFGVTVDETSTALSNLIKNLTGQAPIQRQTIISQVAHDVGVTRAGFLPFPVSAGDVLVDRNALARAVTAPAGGMLATTPTQVGASPQSQQPLNASFEGELSIEIPVVVDGREIARASGRYLLQVDQRRGARIAPGARRRVAEQGSY